jgi:hypothetical protein
MVVPGSGSAVVTVGLSPAQVLLGLNGFRLHLPGGLVFGSSPTQAPPPPTALSVADTPAWQGDALRGVRLLLPEGVALQICQQQCLTTPRHASCRLNPMCVLSCIDVWKRVG